MSRRLYILKALFLLCRASVDSAETYSAENEMSFRSQDTLANEAEVCRYQVERKRGSTVQVVLWYHRSFRETVSHLPCQLVMTPAGAGQIALPCDLLPVKYWGRAELVVIGKSFRFLRDLFSFSFFIQISHFPLDAQHVSRVSR